MTISKTEIFIDLGGGGVSENNVLKWLLRPESEEITGGQRSVNWGAVEIAIRIKKLHLR